MSNDPLQHDGKVRTDLYCHACTNDFSVALDYGLDGNHVVNCPHCAHEHCRVIVAGRVTSDRWAARNGATWPYHYRATNSTGAVWTTTIASTSSSTTSTYLASSWARGTTVS